MYIFLTVSDIKYIWPTQRHLMTRMSLRSQISWGGVLSVQVGLPAGASSEYRERSMPMGKAGRMWTLHYCRDLLSSITPPDK